MKSPWLTFFLALAFSLIANGQESRPNIILITIDDLNDWVGVLGGHPQAHTPNFDRLAERGVLFTNAHCQAPICNPSRTSLLTGKRPTSTGIYDNQDHFRETDLTRNLVTLPQYFSQHGYLTAGCGKLFHKSGNPDEFMSYGPKTSQGPLPDERFHVGKQVSPSKLWDWGTWPLTEDEASDTINARWAGEFLKATDQEKPFLLGVGFYRPHVPLYAPPGWMERYPPETVELPAILVNDTSDLPEYILELKEHGSVAPQHSWFVESGNWKPAVAAYLACVEYMDDCLGQVIDALDSSAHADHTWLFVTGDHGWHLGEKEHWAKRTLWERSTRVPMIVVPPAGESDWARGARCDLPVEMLSFFPTMVEVSGLPVNPENDGRSMLPLLKEPASPSWDHPAVTTHLPGNHAVRTADWRYIRYADGTEELYDHRSDPNEWHNVASDPAHADLKEELSQWIPTKEAAQGG